MSTTALQQNMAYAYKRMHAQNHPTRRRRVMRKSSQFSRGFAPRPHAYAAGAGASPRPHDCVGLNCGTSPPEAGTSAFPPSGNTDDCTAVLESARKCGWEVLRSATKCYEVPRSAPKCIEVPRSAYITEVPRSGSKCHEVLGSAAGKCHEVGRSATKCVRALPSTF